MLFVVQVCLVVLVKAQGYVFVTFCISVIIPHPSPVVPSFRSVARVSRKFRCFVSIFDFRFLDGSNV